MSSDHHHRSSYFKDSYGSSSSSKRYHSPSGSTARGSLGGNSGYYDTASKRSRSDTYGSASGSLHTSSTSSRYNDYSSGSSLLSTRYKPSSSSYYDSPGLKSSSTVSSKYLDDYKGSSRGMMKSSVRRIPPPLTPPSLSSKSLMKSSLGSSSSRPLPLMKVITSSTSGGSHGRESYGSRLRTAPPEHHSASYGHSFSSNQHRRPDFRKPMPYGAVARNPFGPTNFRPSASSNAFRKGTLRAAASVSSKIRRRAVVTNIDERRRKRMDFPHSRRDDKRSHDGHKSREGSSLRKSKDSDSKRSSKEKEKSKDDIKFELDLPGGDVVAVRLLEEVGGDSEDEDNVDGKGKDVDDVITDGKDKDSETAEDADHVVVKTETDETDKLTSPSDDKLDGSTRRNKKREDSPSSRALLKLYCKYCDVRHVTFREYSQHLRSFPHTRAMNTAVTDMRKQLSKQRNQQRDDQRRVEKEEKVLSDTTSYCRVCELNFRTDPKEHEANELHNEIKTLIYQRCDICEIDFRIWKVYLYHMAALEHVKRVAMKELKEAESSGENVKGTNLSQEELGLNLVEVRTVFFCNACVRYLPIKGDHDEARGRHCMTLTHIKCVEEFRQREKRIAERQRKRLEREEKEGKLKAKDKEEEEEEKEKDSNDKTEEENNKTCDDSSEIQKDDDEANEKDKEMVATEKAAVEIKIEENENEIHGEEHVEGEEMDEDEIELHAGDDVPEDDESEDTNGVWNRRTRSSKNAN